MPRVSKRVIISVEPFAWESLEGYLDRVRRTNLYVEQQWVHELLELRPDSRLNLLRLKKQYSQLAALTALDESMLLAMTLHHLVTRFYLPEELVELSAADGDIEPPLWEGHWLAIYGMGQVRAARKKVCPLCWQQYGTLFLPWVLRHVTTCSEHGVLLVDMCVCGAPLKFSTFLPHCRACKLPIAQLPTLPLGDHAPSLELQTLIGSAIGLTQPFPSPILKLPLDHPLHEMHPAALFRFLTFSVQLLAARYPDDPLFNNPCPLPGITQECPPTALHQADVGTVHCAVTTAWCLLKDWPEMWYDLMTRIAAREERDGVKSEHHFPAALFRERELRGPHLGWLHRSWGQFVFENTGRLPGVFGWYRFYQSLRKRLDDGGPDLPDLISQPRARALIGVGMPVLKGYLEVEGAAVRRGREEKPGQPWQLIDVATVEHLRAQHADRRAVDAHLISWADACKYLGIGTAGLRTLVDAGLIRPARYKAADQKHGWGFTPLTLDAQIEELIGHLPVICLKRVSKLATLTLHEALEVVRSAGIGMAELLRDVRDGKVDAFRCSHTFSLPELRFWREGDLGLEGYRARLRSGTEQSEYTSLEVCQLLGCTQLTLQRWWAADLLPPNRVVVDESGEHPRYNAAALDAFRSQYMCSEDVASRLGCHRATVGNWVRAGRLAPAVVWGGGKYNTYLFDRVALDVLIAAWLPTTEAAALLGTDVRTFNMWIEQGLLQPIDPEARKKRLYDRDEVLRVRERLVMSPRTGRPAVVQVRKLGV